MKINPSKFFSFGELDPILDGIMPAVFSILLALASETVLIFAFSDWSKALFRNWILELIFSQATFTVGLFTVVAFSFAAHFARLPARSVTVLSSMFRFLALFVLHLIWLLSWVHHAVFKVFLGQGQFQFFLRNPADLLKHFVSMSPWGCVGIIGLAALLAGLSRTLADLHWIRPPRSRKLVIFNAAIVVLLAANLHVAPGTGAYAELWSRRLSPEVKLSLNGPARVVHRKQVSWDEYLKGVHSPKRWNVIFILVESLRPDQLEVFGGRRVVMPNLESMATQSVLFENGYSQASHSDYADPCPFSSQYPLREFTHHYYPKGATYPRVMLYDVLKRLGYKTAIISSQNEDWGGMKNFMDTGSLDYFFHAGSFDGPTYLPKQDRGFSNWVARNGLRSGKVDDQDTVQEAIRWIDANRSTPFFTYINFQSSHSPYRIPSSYPHRFGPDTVDFPLVFGFFPIGKKSVVMDLYSDSLNYIDSQMGKLFDYLKNAGLWDSTLIAVIGDNGTAFYEHGRADHGVEVYDEGVRTAALMKIPGRGMERVSYPLQHIDLAPTALAALGIPSHPAFQGIDVLSPSRPSVRSLFFVSHSAILKQYAVQRGKYKLLYKPEFGLYELYDLEKDPSESHNLFVSEPEIAQEMNSRLGQWISEQILYYRNQSAQHQFYAPFFED